jgi:hypothetical protein
MLAAALGTQVVGSIVRPASFCGCVGFKPSIGAINRGGSHDNLSQSCDGALASSLEDAWNFCWAIAQRAGGDPGYPGLAGPEVMPSAKAPKTLAVLETAGWRHASDEAKQNFTAAAASLKGAGVAIVDRRSDATVSEIETALAVAVPLTRRINAWESRWPLSLSQQARAVGKCWIGSRSRGHDWTITPRHRRTCIRSSPPCPHCDADHCRPQARRSDCSRRASGFHGTVIPRRAPISSGSRRKNAARTSAPRFEQQDAALFAVRLGRATSCGRGGGGALNKRDMAGLPLRLAPYREAPAHPGYATYMACDRTRARLLVVVDEPINGTLKCIHWCAGE